MTLHEVLMNVRFSFAASSSLLATLLLLGACAKQSSQPDPETAASETQAGEPGHGPPGHEQRGGPGHHAPPEEAYAACAGKSADDACTVKHGDRESAGTCGEAPPSEGSGDARLVCRPEGGPRGDGPPRGPGGPPRP